MERKTYGIENLVDWKAQINAGKAKVTVHFAGGAITRYGVTPAEFTTVNPMIQHVIENSDYFKSGRIKLLRVLEVEGEAPQILGRKKEEVPAPAEPTATAEAPVVSAELREAEAAVSAEVATGTTEVEVTCLQDAQDYLKEKFGLSATSVRSYEKAQAAAAERGIVFVGGKFSEPTEE